MTEQLARDALARALAALRERGTLPQVDIPPLTLTPLDEGIGYRSTIGSDLAAEVAAAVAAGTLPDDGATTADTLAQIIARYLAEVVDLVPAYSGIARITAAPDGAVHFYLREDA